MRSETRGSSFASNLHALVLISMLQLTLTLANFDSNELVICRPHRFAVSQIHLHRVHCLISSRPRRFVFLSLVFDVALATRCQMQIV